MNGRVDGSIYHLFWSIIILIKESHKLKDFTVENKYKEQKTVQNIVWQIL